MKYGRLLFVCAATFASSPLDPATAVTSVSSACMNAVEQQQPLMSKARQDMQAAQASGNQAAMCSAMHEMDPAITVIVTACTSAELSGMSSSIQDTLTAWQRSEAALCKPGAVMLTPRQPLVPPATRGVPLRH